MVEQQIHPLMKTLLAVIAAAAAFGIAAPSTANANPYCNPGQTRVVGYTSWGAPIMAVYQVVGYDRWGHPIGQWVTQAAPCRPSYGPSYGGYSGGYGGGYSGGYSGGHHHHGSSGGYYGRPRSGVSFSFGFGR